MCIFSTWLFNYKCTKEDSTSIVQATMHYTSNKEHVARESVLDHNPVSNLSINGSANVVSLWIVTRLEIWGCRIL